jgi:hypothetical protein
MGLWGVEEGVAQFGCEGYPSGPSVGGLGVLGRETIV